MLELAGRGTVFLDEIGELPVALQDRLLRTLEEYSIPRFGIGNESPVHCRVIAASKSRLEDYVAAGLFREDLLAAPRRCFASSFRRCASARTTLA